MKVIIQIPCFNEEEYIPLTLSKLPRTLEGVDSVEYLVIDDGSADGTVKAAREAGAHHVLELNSHQGLAKAFMAGLEQCLRLRADVIVNTDADNQYNADDIQKLIGPVIDGKAGMVIGVRPVRDIKHFSFMKKILHGLGSWFVGKVTGLDIMDAPSGFRALSRETALRLNVFSNYTYTLESIIQARFKNIRIETVQVKVNEKLRESRLIKSDLSYIVKSIKTIFGISLIYNPGWFLNRLGALFFLAGTGIGGRFMYFYFKGGGKGHIQSLVLLSVLFTLGLGCFLLSVVAGLISVNRRLAEDVQYRIKKDEYQKG